MRSAKDCYTAKEICKSEGKPLLDCASGGPLPDPITGHGVLFSCGAASGWGTGIEKVACEAAKGTWTGTDCVYPSTQPPSWQPPEPQVPGAQPPAATPSPPGVPPSQPTPTPTSSSGGGLTFIVVAAVAVGGIAYLMGRQG